MLQQEYVPIDESDDYTTTCTTDNSEDEDPSFDLMEEETRSRFANLSVKRKPASCSRLVKKKDESADEDETEEIASGEVIVPELDAKDQKSFEIVQKIIGVGQVDKLKVEQCKVYLRKHGLRLTGNKDTLLHRIKEHLNILNGNVKKKYPASSFVMNCKGDACTGDIVMFEQNVYEMFNIASRSAGGPPCGTRVVVGRIVKESYGAAKQQHTFTIEVLWNEGVKPLPPLHPLLIKGRNLYRLKIMRQRWEDEGERQKILFEKHTRGSIARSNREARIQGKDIRKKLKENRVPRMKNLNGKLEENKIKASQVPALNFGIHQRQSTEQQVRQKTHQEPIFKQKKLFPPLKENKGDPLETLHRVPTFFPGRVDYKENGSCGLSMGIFNMPVDSQKRNFDPSRSPFRGAPQDEKNLNSSKSSFGGHFGKQRINFDTRISSLIMSSQFQQITNITYAGYQFQGHSIPFRNQSPRKNNNDYVTASHRPQGHGHEQKQLCRYYPQGRCYYGDRCKYLH